MPVDRWGARVSGRREPGSEPSWADLVGEGRPSGADRPVEGRPAEPDRPVEGCDAGAGQAVEGSAAGPARGSSAVTGDDGREPGPERSPGPGLGSRLWRDAREVAGTVLVALAIAVLVKTFLVQPFYIPSESMETTLLVGDRVLVSKLEPGPLSLERGDVAVFVDPGGWLPAGNPEPGPLVRTLTFVGLLPANSGEHLIKRVIGLPGDTVECCDDSGRLLVNGLPIDEPYLFAGDSPSQVEFSVAVPPGRLWVMGDHRSVSEDSRYHLGDPGGGSVPLDNVVGRAVLVMWPLDRWSILPTPSEVFDRVGGEVGVG